MRYVVADDHPSVTMMVDEMFRQLTTEGDEILVVDDSHVLLDLVRHSSEQVLVVLDLVMPGPKRLKLLHQVFQLQPNVKVVAHTADESPFFAIDVMDAGALGYVLKSSLPSVLLHAIGAVQRGAYFFDPGVETAHVNGHPWSKLTERQAQTCVELCRQGSINDIARTGGSHYRTVYDHWNTAKKVLGIKTVAQLGAFFLNNGLVYLLEE